MLAIIGATGMLGQPVAHQLIWAGNAVRIIARNVAEAKGLFPHVEVVPGDLRNPDSLLQALQGVDTVYLSLSVRQTEKRTDFHTETDGLRNLLTAARQAGVTRIAYLSSLVMRYQGMNGFRWWVFEVKHEAVRLIKDSGLRYSIFYPSCFMESINTVQRMGRFILVLGRSPVRPWYISAHDYGKQVARALKQASDNQEYVIQGPEALTQHEAAERFTRAYTASPVRVLTSPLFFLKMGSAFSTQANYGWHIGEALNSYPEQFEAEKTWADLGKPQTTIDQFAADQ
ncbi:MULTISPECIES: SDR family oxidoreductase [Spirosoma]|uniref:NAD-dependent epimerase/dehydratase family protein n=1 Tax=Spirosoma sordidisoli TaxID=2502893 RepID=A0A4Q2UI17_9BACT|nr:MULTISPECIES: NAD(P)H-binding protein [Spirosoma]RYC66389.1 NAD-dependent epimerase/dehydratase family protein [Spirosoma sordidisoli]